MISKLRVFIKNGGDLSKIWLQKFKEETKREAQGVSKCAVGMEMGNVAVLNKGKVTPLYRTLRDIKYGNSI